MTGDDAGHFTYGVMALALVGSALVARRLPLRQSLKYIGAWLIIIALVFVLFLFRDEGRQVWRRVTAEFAGADGVTNGRTLRIPRSDDGHFWVNVQVNSVTGRFLIDSGATVTALSPGLAQSAGISADRAFPVAVQTANGIVENYRATIAMLKVGPIRVANAPALIQASDDNTNLIGMSFLSTLKSWRIENGTLILEPTQI